MERRCGDHGRGRRLRWQRYGADLSSRCGSNCWTPWLAAGFGGMSEDRKTEMLFSSKSARLCTGKSAPVRRMLLPSMDADGVAPRANSVLRGASIAIG
jgi:hypothetical protein